MSDTDVSVVLNMHREAPYLRATLLSLDACAQTARDAGLRCELVAVFDRADALTRQVFEATSMTGFEACVMVDVDVGSLGLARNAGVKAASGEFIWTADGDDLVSQNAIVELHGTATANGQANCAVFMNYLVAFGNKFLVGKYYDSSYLTIADYVWHHPYISRIFVRRTVFKNHGFSDLRLTSGFAYEDWDFLVRLRYEGFRFLIASGTVFFYRQRADSLLRQADSMSAQMIPHSSFLEPGWFNSELEREKRAIANWVDFVEERQRTNLIDYAKELISSPPLIEAVMDANRLDPEVDPAQIANSPSYSPVPWHEDHLGFRLAEAYRLIGSEKYTDFVILPSLNPGRFEDYILQILQKISDNVPQSNTLVICCEPSQRHMWMERLPPQAILLDTYNAFPTLSDGDRDRLVVRLLLAASLAKSRLHLGPSISSRRLIETYGSILLDHFSAYFYRINPEFIDWNGWLLEPPAAMSLLRKHASEFEKVICDAECIAVSDKARIGLPLGNYVVIPPVDHDSASVQDDLMTSRVIEAFSLGTRSGIYGR
jgi:glycosyltransferase involved in cell wall biosynthesis